MNLFAGTLRKASEAAASLTGKRFSLLVASSLVATTGVVAVALGGTGGVSPLEEAAARALLESESAAVAAVPAAAPEAGPIASPSSPVPAPSAGAASSGSLPAPAPAPAPAPEPEAPAPPPAESEGPEPGPVKHVFLVSLASPGYEASLGAATQMPYLSGELRPQGLLLTNYSLLDAAPLPNGIAAIGGQPPSAATEAGCPSYEACLQDVETLTIADQLSAAQLSWHGYFEGMTDPEGKPDTCVHPEPEAADVPTPEGYSSLLNPFVFFHSLLDLGACDENAVPLGELAGDLKKPETTANLSYVSPGLCGAGFRGKCPEGTADGAAAADAFLAEVVPGILASAAYKEDGLLIVSFGAADPAPPADPAAAPEADPKKVGALLVSPLLAPGSTDGTAYDPYSLLRSLEDMFGLQPLEKAGGAKVRSFASAFAAGNGGD
ncbi:MAG TPA: alkaline phosphatase family protein [Solirubrobacterales bacterium]|nr:alkaline phosphatase family protein [Solirubrobacterales bacterium]